MAGQCIWGVDPLCNVCIRTQASGTFPYSEAKLTSSSVDVPVWAVKIDDLHLVAAFGACFKMSRRCYEGDGKLVACIYLRAGRSHYRTL